jgi:hypothetical protein
LNVEVFKNAIGVAKLKVAPVMFQVRKHLPEILVATGAVSVVGGTVLACKATVEAKDILDEEIETTVTIVADDEEFVHELTESEIRREQIGKGLHIVKIYAAPAGLVVGGVGMLVAAKSIEHRRLTAALGAYSSLQAMFDEYRERVALEQGEDKEKLIFSGTSKGEIVEEAEDGKKPKKHKLDFPIRDGEDPYHRLFDDCNCPHVWRDNLEENRFFLECQQKALDMRLQYTGRVFLNEVYEALGFSYLPIGQFVGWLSDDIEGSKDGHIDFGIDYAYLRSEIEAAQREQRTPEPSIWLNFNCDGEVWSNPMRKKR